MIRSVLLFILCNERTRKVLDSHSNFIQPDIPFEEASLLAIANYSFSNMTVIVLYEGRSKRFATQYDAQMTQAKFFMLLFNIITFNICYIYQTAF